MVDILSAGGVPLLAKVPQIEYEIRTFDGGDQRLYAPYFYQNGQPVGFMELASPPAIPGLPPPTPGIPFTSTNRAFIREYLTSRMPNAVERKTDKGLRAVW